MRRPEHLPPLLLLLLLFLFLDGNFAVNLFATGKHIRVSCFHARLLQSDAVLLKNTVIN